MKIGDALAKGIASLKKFNIPGAATDAAVLLGHVLECTRLALTVRRAEIMEEELERQYFSLISRRCNHEPVSYITGKKEFMSMDFCVEPGVLIPRPDTEILVELVASKLAEASCPHIVDMCTGTGAIAVSLAKLIPESRVTALDISPVALRLADKNARLNHVCISVEDHDVLTPYRACADAVVSNPPYITTEVIDSLDRDVAEYEPRLALDGGEDGLVFYRAIADNIRSSLRIGGLLAFEVGHDQADAVMDIMKKDFCSIDVARDLAGIRRVVYGYLRQSQSLGQ